jgi:hypothetical protein
LTKAKYTDKYYDTQDLTKVSRTDAVPDSIAECIAMDAFFGSIIDKDKVANVDLDLSVTLKRPFARITLIQKPLSLLATVRAVGFSYEEGYQAFNIQTGDTVYAAAKKDTLTLTNNGEVFQMAEGGIFAYAYLFAPADDGAETESVINVSFYGDEEAENKIGETFALPAEQPYMRNYVTNITENYLDPTGDLDVDHNPNYDIGLTDYQAISILEAARTFTSEEDPLYNEFVLDTSEELFALAHAVNNGLKMPADVVETEYAYAGAYYELGDDIDLEDEPWTPIGNTPAAPFSGTFNGQGHKISNLSVSGAAFAGLFGMSMGQIAYLMVEGNVAGSGVVNNGNKDFQIVGGIVSVGMNVRFCSFEGSLSASWTSAGQIEVGGIAGEGMQISNCVSMLSEVSITAGNETTVHAYGIGTGEGATYCAWLPVGGITKGANNETNVSNPENLATLIDELNNLNGVNTGATAFEWFDDDGTLNLRVWQPK